MLPFTNPVSIKCDAFLKHSCMDVVNASIDAFFAVLSLIIVLFSSESRVYFFLSEISALMGSI